MVPVQVAIVTNRSALNQKYGHRLDEIDRALATLLYANKQRGLAALVIDLADAATMKQYAARPVTKHLDPRQNKNAIDKIFHKLEPDYLLLLGATDIIPHQDLVNPLYDSEDPWGDPDPVLYSDLPYACEHSYDRRSENFLGPTRVVGRLPDVTGSADAGYLATVIESSAHSESRSAADYTDHLSISTRAWQQSTEQSVRAIFRSVGGVETSPPDGPRWPARQLRRRSHFINCHGAPADPRFYGQQGGDFPIAHDAAYLDGKISVGTVCAAECCYGAELYDPAATGAERPGICNAYLHSGAYAFFGSSTIAYGPADKNALADVITQDFMRHILAGASNGRACLQARQDFVMKAGILDPFSLKTLAQFSLLADPSIHPVRRLSGDDAVIMTKTHREIPAGEWERLSSLALRRDRLKQNGLALAGATHSVVTSSRRVAPARIVRLVRQFMPETEPARVLTFKLRGQTAPQKKSLHKVKPTRTHPAIHVAVASTVNKDAPTPQFVGILAREGIGSITVRKFQSR